MRICYVVPGVLRARPGGEAEAALRLACLRTRARAGTELEIVDDPQGPASIESAEAEQRAAHRIADLVAALDHDAAVIGCFGDPGLERARAATTMPVIGPAAASFACAVGLGGRFGILTVMDGVVGLLRGLVADNGWIDRLAGVESIGVPVLELRARRADVLERLCGRAEVLIDAGADTLVLGCMTMGFIEVADELERRVGVPVVNPVVAALEAAETAAGETGAGPESRPG